MATTPDTIVAPSEGFLLANSSGTSTQSSREVRMIPGSGMMIAAPAPSDTAEPIVMMMVAM